MWIMLSFQVSGIQPLDPNVFQESDFAPSFVPDRPEESTVEASGTNDAVDDIIRASCGGDSAVPTSTSSSLQPGKYGIINSNTSTAT